MANHKATIKDTRQNKKRNKINKLQGKTARNAVKGLKSVTDKNLFSEKAPKVESLVDRLAKKGVIHKNKAANIKRKLSIAKAKLI